MRDSLVGWVIDERYEVLQLLGEGGMGCVYRVRHRVLGRQFALKALRPELAQDSVLAERFVQEARAAAAISHPNVVSITDFGMLDRGQPYFVMELLEGRTLSSVLRERDRLEPEEAAFVARSIASALSAAHEAGVIHRDLKPDNVVLLGDASAPTALKVLDFGLAKVVGLRRLTSDDIVYGTPQYMCPEQAAGEPLDARVDVYALGILMYEMLTGRVPFESDSYMGVLTKQLYAEPVPPAELCPAVARLPGFEAIVLRCLRKNRDDRYANMAEVIAAIELLGIEVPNAVAPESMRSRHSIPARNPLDSRIVRRAISRRRWWTYALLGVVALGAALGLLFGRLHGGDSDEDRVIRAVPQARPANTGASTLAKEPRESSARRASSTTATTNGALATAKSPSISSSARPAKVGSGRSTGQPRQPSTPRAEPSRGDATTTFGEKSTTGSSEIANPWAK